MSAIFSYILDTLRNSRNAFNDTLDGMFPPEQRAKLHTNLQAHVISYPKTTAFIGTQLIITGLPLLIFLTFSLSVFVFSLAAALLLGFLAATLFTIFAVGLALIVVLPIIFIAIFVASFIFLVGLSGYYLLDWFNAGSGIPPKESGNGDRLDESIGAENGSITFEPKKKQDGTGARPDLSPRIHMKEEDRLAQASRKGCSDERSTPTRQEDEARKSALKLDASVRKETQKLRRGQNGTTEMSKDGPWME